MPSSSRPVRPAPFSSPGAASASLGRGVALALAAGGWQVAVHYRHSSRRGAGRPWPTAPRARACASAAGQRRPGRRGRRCASLLPAGGRRSSGGVDAVVNSATSLFEAGRRARASVSPPWRRIRTATPAPIRAGAGPARPRGVWRAGHGRRAGRRGEPAGPEALEPEPRFLSYTLSKAALEAANTMLALALAPLVRVVGVAPRPHARASLAERREVSQPGISCQPLGRSSTAADVAATVQVRAGEPAPSPARRCWWTVAST